jgi:hypothetical protein
MEGKMGPIEDALIEDIYPRYSDVCNHCKHFRCIYGSDQGICAAFPDRIPDDIWLGRNDHKQPYPGDHGVLFEERKPK